MSSPVCVAKLGRDGIPEVSSDKFPILSLRLGKPGLPRKILRALPIPFVVEEETLLEYVATVDNIVAAVEGFVTLFGSCAIFCVSDNFEGSGDITDKEPETVDSIPAEFWRPVSCELVMDSSPFFPVLSEVG